MRGLVRLDLFASPLVFWLSYIAFAEIIERHLHCCAAPSKNNSFFRNFRQPEPLHSIAEFDTHGHERLARGCCQSGGSSSVLDDGKSVIPEDGSAQQNHASYSLKGLGIRLCFPAQSRSPFRVKNVLADDDVRPNCRSRIGNYFAVFNANRRLRFS
jgi:hypothetical protein